MHNDQDDCIARAISHSRANELQSQFVEFSTRVILALILPPCGKVEAGPIILIIFDV